MGKLGIIGGSGVYFLNSFKQVGEERVDTPYGEHSSGLQKFYYNDPENDFYFLPRHGKNHVLNPTEVNYKANIYALRKLGVSTLLSISAVGSLDASLSPGYFVLPNQFIDWTRNCRKRTFFNNGVVGHVSLAHPFCRDMQKLILETSKKIDIPVADGGTYICIEGPQFSTTAESKMYINLGANIVGMTLVPEVNLAAEANMAYATICMVTDFDAWKEEKCDLQEVLTTLSSNKKKVQALISNFVSSYFDQSYNFVPNQDASEGIWADTENLSETNRAIVNTLLKK